MELSVLLPLSGPPERSRACLDSLERTLPRRLRYEVILVEDAENSLPRDLRDHLGCAPHHQLLRHEGSPGRAACLNAAARAAHASVLCLLDPGTTLMPGWLEPMLPLLRGGNGKTVGCIGNVHREPYSGLIDHAGIAFDATGLPVPIGRNQALLPRETFARCPAVSAACCLVGRERFRGVGRFRRTLCGPLSATWIFAYAPPPWDERHYVANRSVVYHHATERSRSTDGDLLALPRALGGSRPRVFPGTRRPGGASRSFPPNAGKPRARSAAKRRQDVRDARQDGRRYLGKHWFRPWRYNYDRVCRALVQSTHPLPAALPRPPVSISDDDMAGALFLPGAHRRTNAPPCCSRPPASEHTGFHDRRRHGAQPRPLGHPDGGALTRGGVRKDGRAGASGGVAPELGSPATVTAGLVARAWARNRCVIRPDWPVRGLLAQPATWPAWLLSGGRGEVVPLHRHPRHRGAPTGKLGVVARVALSQHARAAVGGLRACAWLAVGGDFSRRHPRATPGVRPAGACPRCTPNTCARSATRT